MGFLGKLFRGTAPPVTVLVEAITQLQVGILTNLMVGYRSRVAPSDVPLFAASVLSAAILEPPISAEATEFSEAHSALVREETLKLGENPEVVDALSYLYAVKTLHLAFVTRNPLSEDAEKLGARATQLGIYIPNTYDICGSGDAIECIRAIGEFAKKYREQAFGK